MRSVSVWIPWRRGLLVKVGNAIEENDMAKVVEADIEFHDVLYKASRNERLRNIINNLREQITVIRGVSMRYPGRLKDTQEEHRRLVESIAARNVEKSQEAARIHLENAERTLMIAMSERKGGEELRNIPAGTGTAGQGAGDAEGPAPAGVYTGSCPAEQAGGVCGPGDPQRTRECVSAGGPGPAALCL